MQSSGDAIAKKSCSVAYRFTASGRNGLVELTGHLYTGNYFFLVVGRVAAISIFIFTLPTDLAFES